MAQSFNGFEFIYDDNITDDELVLENLTSLKAININSKKIRSIKVYNCNNLTNILIRNQDILNSVEIIYEISDLNVNLFVNNCVVSSFELSGSYNHVSVVNTNINEFLIKRANIIYLGVNSLDNDNNVKFKIRNFRINNSSIEYAKIKALAILFFKTNNYTIKKFSAETCDLGEIEINDTKITTDNNSIDTEIYGKVKAEIEFKNVKINDVFNLMIFDINSENTDLEIILSNVNFGKSAFIQIPFNPSKTNLRISKIKSYEQLHIQGKSKLKSNLNIFLNYTSECEGILTLENLLLDEIIVQGTNNKLTTTINTCSINYIRYENFDNLGIFKVINSTNITDLVVKNSDLNNVVFRPFKVVRFSIYPDSFIGGMKIYGSDVITLEKTLPLDQKEEFYRQLKQAAKNSNNKFLELEYKAREMENYNPKTKKDKFLHWVNSISGHGTNWVLPIYYMIFINIPIWLLIMYNLYCNKFNELKCSDNYTCYSLLDFTFGLGIIVNPLSRFSEFKSYLVHCDNIPAIVTVLFFLSKIINWVLIYQMVSAFRKWVSKD